MAAWGGLEVWACWLVCHWEWALKFQKPVPFPLTLSVPCLWFKMWVHSCCSSGLLHAACFLLPASCCMLPAYCCLSPATWFLLPESCCLLPAAWVQFPAVCCLLPESSFLLSAACFLLSAAWFLLPLLCHQGQLFLWNCKPQINPNLKFVLVVVLYHSIRKAISTVSNQKKGHVKRAYGNLRFYKLFLKCD